MEAHQPTRVAAIQELKSLAARPMQVRAGDSTINTIRKAAVAYPTIKRLLFHFFYESSQALGDTWDDVI